MLLARFSNKERLNKNKIGILATSFHRVKDIPRNLVKKDYIYLLANKDMSDFPYEMDKENYFHTNGIALTQLGEGKIK